MKTTEKLFDLPSEADNIFIKIVKLAKVNIKQRLGIYNVKGWEAEN